MTEFQQKQGFSVKKSEVLSVTPNKTQASEELKEINATYEYLKERLEKIKSHGVEIPHLKDLVLRNFQEWIAVQALRTKKNCDKTKQTQNLLNKFKSVF